MEISEVIQKVRKLMALAQSSNEHEAALAAAKAQTLMLEHKLSEGDLDSAVLKSKDPITEAFTTESIGKFAYMQWKGALMYGIAKLNNCAALLCDSKRLKIIGRTSDRQVVEYLSCYLIREVERLAFESYARAGFCDKTKRWTWTQSFGSGSIPVILKRMRDEKESFLHQNPSCTALVKRDDTAIQDYMRGLDGVRKGRKSKAKLSADGYYAGRVAGSTISWHAGVGGRGAAQIA